MAGTTRLELATSAVTVSIFNDMQGTDGTLSHCKYILDKDIVYRGVYHAIVLPQVSGFILFTELRACVRFPSPAPKTTMIQLSLRR